MEQMNNYTDKSGQIILKIEDNEFIQCPICGVVFTKDSFGINELTCKNGHKFFAFTYTPTFEGKTERKQSLWLVIEEKLSFEQLKVIRNLFSLKSLNLSEVKNMFREKGKYLVLQDEYESIVNEKAIKLLENRIKFVIDSD